MQSEVYVKVSQPMLNNVSQPFIAIRLVDDILVMSSDPELCEIYYDEVAKHVNLNAAKE